MRRFLALHLPDLATDRLRRLEPALPHEVPLASWAVQGPRRALVAVDRAASAAGLRPGQALADAQAMVPGLALRPADPEADARALHALALWARRWTPLSALDAPDGLLLDITGCGHLLGGEAALMQDAIARLRRSGLVAQGAIAGAAATAGALARGHADGPIVASGGERAAVAPLPLQPALRPCKKLRQRLERLGLREVGHLLHQPRGPLARRFGQALLDELDALTGQRPTTLCPVVPEPELTAVQDLMEPVINRTGIEHALDALLEVLCLRLARAGRGVRRLTLLAWRVDGLVQEVTIGTGLATRTAGHLRRLLAEKLGTLEPDLGFERMALEARATEPLAAGLACGLGLADEAAAATALTELVDRLAQRLRVRRIQPVASHWPERAVIAMSPHAAPLPTPVEWIRHPQPALLLRRPQAIEAVNLLPDGPPALLRWHGRRHPVHRVEGPLRLEPEWWRLPQGALRRDYHRVELASGARLWVFRAGAAPVPTWLMHGHMP